MKTLYEGILSDIDTAVGSMDKGIEDAMCISTLPTIKDIMSADWSKDVYNAYWKCPHIMQQYKHLPIVNNKIIKNDFIVLPLIVNCQLSIINLIYRSFTMLSEPLLPLQYHPLCAQSLPTCRRAALRQSGRVGR